MICKHCFLTGDQNFLGVWLIPGLGQEWPISSPIKSRTESTPELCLGPRPSLKMVACGQLGIVNVTDRSRLDMAPTSSRHLGCDRKSYLLAWWLNFFSGLSCHPWLQISPRVLRMGMHDDPTQVLNKHQLKDNYAQRQNKPGCTEVLALQGSRGSQSSFSSGHL